MKQKLLYIVRNPGAFSKSVVAMATTVLATGAANAAAMTLPTELSDALLSVAVIGAGVFAIAVGVKLYKWIKGAL